MRPCWNVYVGNPNRRKIDVINVFEHPRFAEDCRETLAEAIKEGWNSEQIAERVRLHLCYYFGHKCEWEIILSDWPPSKNFNSEKVSVYDQVMLNFDSFMKRIYESFPLETDDNEVGQ